MNPTIPQTGGSTATVIQFPREPWVTKKQLAEHLGYSVRWIEMRVASGMPRAAFPGPMRFKISQVENWLTAQAATR
jgi:hypothetical protein